MTANALKDKLSNNDLLSPIAESVASNILVLMQHFGIKKIEIRSIKHGVYNRLFSVITPFEGTPNEIEAAGILVKDALASILAAVGIVALEISAEKSEVDSLISNFNAIINIKKAAENGTLESKDTDESSVKLTEVADAADVADVDSEVDNGAKDAKPSK